MKKDSIKIKWPNGTYSISNEENYWLDEARKAGVNIPTGCLNGSCGACEIDINGETIRACISKVHKPQSEEIKVEFTTDPFW